MAVASTTTVVETLELTQLLTAEQLEEVKSSLVPKHGEAKALVQELVNRRWLTLFQGKQLLLGYGKSLVLGPYLLLDRVGKGGFGQVFKAKHRYMNRVVAVKTLNADAFKDKETIQRFRREIEVASQLAHPNIVHAYEAGPIGSVLALVLEYVEGANLGQLVEKNGPLPVSVACEYIRQAASGLQYAHEQGFVHRDIKPSNLLVTRSGPRTGLEVIKILDLGLARASQPPEGMQTGHLTVLGGQTMQGTPDFMAPEQAMDFHNADIRSDIYSLGCTLFYLLAGHPPFPAGTLAEKLLRHQQSPVEIDGLRADLPPELADVVRTMMAKKPEDRYQTPGEVADALGPFCGASRQSSETIRTRSAGTVETPTATQKVHLENSHKTAMRTEPPVDPPAPAESPSEARPTSGGRGFLVAVVLLVLLAGGGVGGFFLLSGDREDTQAQTTPTGSGFKTRTSVINFSNGFEPIWLKLNGNASVTKEGRLRLTNAKNNERGSAYSITMADVRAFATEFTFKLTRAEGDGFAFVIQNHAENALGGAGGGLGYSGISKSVAVKFDLLGNNEENTTGVFVRGASPGQPSRKLIGVDLKSGHLMKARLEYSSNNLTVTVTDTETGKSHTETFDVDITGAVGETRAFVGFTGSTGGRNAIQEILTWTFQQG